MFKSRFFAAYYWLARYWRGGEAAPVIPVGWIVYDFDLQICRQVDLNLPLTSKKEFNLSITRLRDFDV